MNSLYPELAEIAADLLREFGQVATLKQQKDAIYNEATGNYETQEIAYTGNAAAFGYNAREIDGRDIVQGDLKVYLERIAIAPKVGDTIELNNAIWRIKNVQPIEPAAWAVVWVLQVGR